MQRLDFSYKPNLDDILYDSVNRRYVIVVAESFVNPTPEDDFLCKDLESEDMMPPYKNIEFNIVSNSGIFMKLIPADDPKYVKYLPVGIIIGRSTQEGA